MQRLHRAHNVRIIVVNDYTRRDLQSVFAYTRQNVTFGVVDDMSKSK